MIKLMVYRVGQKIDTALPPHVHYEAVAEGKYLRLPLANIYYPTYSLFFHTFIYIHYDFS